MLLRIGGVGEIAILLAIWIDKVTVETNIAYINVVCEVSFFLSFSPYPSQNNSTVNKPVLG